MMTIIFQELAIHSLTSPAPNIFRIRLSAPTLAEQALPGQFVMIRPLNIQEPLLPRPFSIHRVLGDRLDILFKVRGAGTHMLARMNKGDPLEIRGPLGKGFRFGEEEELVLVAGGMGVAPLLFAAEYWKGLFQGKARKKLRVFLGARTREELLGLKAFQRLGAELHVATDDGSFGEKGPITRLLQQVMVGRVTGVRLLACGPTAMLRSVQRWVLKKGIPGQLSLETRMACGLGACLGCVTARERGGTVSYVNVCQEGPVFDAREVVIHDRT
jgi:dihydroorotate dehydrogenase electron transfer subunit